MDTELQVWEKMRMALLEVGIAPDRVRPSPNPLAACRFQPNSLVELRIVRKAMLLVGHTNSANLSDGEYVELMKRTNPGWCPAWEIR